MKGVRMCWDFFLREEVPQHFKELKLHVEGETGGLLALTQIAV